MSTDHDRIAVVDFGGQYAHLIATKVRRAKVLAEIRQPEDSLEAFAGYKGVILSGSPSLSSFGEDSDWNKAILDLDVPILGFCFGHQEIAKRYGGEVIHGGREWGRADLHIRREHPIFKGLGKVEQVWMSHFDSVAALGPDFEELGFTVTGSETVGHANAVIVSDKLKRYGFGGISARGYAGAWARFGTVDEGPIGRRVSRFQIYHMKGPKQGKFSVSVDGAEPTLVDTRADSVSDGRSSMLPMPNACSQCMV